MSANLELDDTGGVASYEEYTPFGTTTVQLSGSAIEADVVNNVQVKRLLVSAALSYWKTPEDASTGKKFGIAFGIGLLGGVVGYGLSVTVESLKEGKKGFDTSDARTTAQIAEDKDAGQTGHHRPREGLLQDKTDLQNDKADLENSNSILQTLNGEANDSVTRLKGDVGTLADQVDGLTEQLDTQAQTNNNLR
ncbi:hypothetical protein ACHAQD_005862, partial [Fusarium lateritium]